MKSRMKTFSFRLNVNIYFHRSTQNQTVKTNSNNTQSSPNDNHALFYPPPPIPFGSRQDSTSTCKSNKLQNVNMKISS